MTETTETTTRKTDLTDGRGTDAVTADLRTRITEARAVIDTIDWAEIDTDADLWDELDYHGIRIVNDDTAIEGLSFVDAGRAGRTALTVTPTTPLQAWATTTAYEAQHDGGSHQWYTETTDGITVVEGDDEVTSW